MVASWTEAQRSLVGEALRFLRTDCGMTQKQLAERCSSRSCIVDYEAGNSTPKTTTLLAILDALGKDLHDFADAYARAEREAGLSSGTGLAKHRTPTRTYLVVELGKGDKAADSPTGADLVPLDDVLDKVTTFMYRQAAVREVREEATAEDSSQELRPSLSAKVTR